jgi:hypothetical protein
MKRLSYITALILINVLLCAGCNEDNPAESVTPDQPGSLILEGKMTDWSYGADKQLRFAKAKTFGREEVFALGITRADGSFRLAVPPPPALFMRPINEIYDTSSWNGTIEISDTSAKFFKGEPALFNGKEYLGGIVWTDMAYADPDSGIWKYSEEVYYYFNADISVRGKVYNPKNSEDYMAFYFSAKAGWNRLLFRTNQEWNYAYVNAVPINGRYLFNGVMYTD